MGLVAILLAGGPFLLTGLEVTTAYPANRFTLPFMLGVSLVLAGLLHVPAGTTSAWVGRRADGLAAGRQALWAEDFRRDWITQKIAVLADALARARHHAEYDRAAE